MKKNFLTSRFCFAILSCLVSILVAAQPDTWQSKAGGFGNISQFAFSINGKGYFGLGPASPEVWEYDATLDLWTRKADFPGSLRDGVASFATATKGYVGTGRSNLGFWLDDFWEFDPVANTWTARATFPGGQRYNATGFAIGAKGYFGMGYNGSYLNDLWEYDPATDTWTAKANLPGAGREYPFSFSISGMGYVGAGKTGFFGPWTNDFWQYNPGTDSWVRKADFTTLPRWGATGGAIGNRGFAGGGYDNVGFVFLNDFWEYDPASDTWIQRANLGGGVRSGGQTFSIGGKLFLGMGGNPSQLFDLWEYTPQGGTNNELWGVTKFGGINNTGTVFSINPDGSNYQKKLDFVGTNGRSAEGGLVRASDGAFYGMTIAGGNNDLGVFYKIQTDGTFTKLLDFGSSTITQPVGNLIQGSDGDFYGMAAGFAVSCGSIFKITSSGVYTNLYNFGGFTTGCYPYGELTEASDGNFYGFTGDGGTFNAGTFFRITPAGVFSLLHHFNPSTDGIYARGGLVEANDGDLYGVASGGGVNGLGTIFKISKAGVFTKLLDCDATTGYNPFGTLTKGNDGKLYGVASQGGASGFGTFFSVSTTGMFTKLYDFTGTDGQEPMGKLLSVGNDFYGTCRVGGANNFGTIFKISKSGAFIKLRDFAGIPDGSGPHINSALAPTNLPPPTLPPAITSFTPSSGAIGSTVLITGTNFDPMAVNNIVKFNGTTAVVSASTSTTITTTVPSGATTGPIKVTVGGNTATSSTNFTPILPENSITFNGNTQSVQLGNWFNYQNFTVSMWLKPGATQVAYANIIDNKHGTSINWVLQQDFLTTNRYCFGAGGVCTYVNLTENIWQNVTLVANAGTYSIFLNGCLAAQSVASSIFYDGNQMLSIGSYSGGTTRYWNGEMDEVKIYNRALTDAEILNAVYNPESPTVPNLQAYYKMNQSGGPSLGDSSPNERSGTLINTPTFQTSTIPTVAPPPPTFASFTPTTGLPGTTVTITGTNFDLTPANNIVKFNGTTAVVSASTTNTLTVIVPSGATAGTITVQVGCSTATSSASFFVPVCFPANGQNADVVLGQTNFTTATSGSGNNKFAGVGSVAVHHASGKIFVADIGNNRILRFSAAQANTIGGVAEAVIGQPDFTTTSAGLSASKLNFPIAITIDQNSGALWVADANNHRILRFDNATTISSGASANGVLGQSNFITGTAPVVTAAAVGFPWGVALDSNGDLWVGERAWNRVTKFPNAAALPNGSAATVVIGQTNFSSAGIGTSATTLWRPNNVAIDVLGNLWVADELNDRVLKFSDAKNLVTGAAAAVVLGQVDFFGNSFATAQNRMYGPIGLHADIFGNIWVGDWANQRVLQFVNAASLLNGANASKVLGAPNFTAIFGGTAQNRTQPVPGLAVDHLGNVYVADDFNRRVLRFNAPSATPIPSVVAVCSGTAATLMATGANPAQEYRWYDVANGGSSLGSSDSFTTPNLTVSSTYYVSLVDAVCNYESGRQPLTVNIISAPIAPATTSAGRCSSGSLALSATGASPGQYRWYTQATGGTAIAGEVNDTYTTPSLPSTTTYYVSINNGTCESNRTAVTATINPLPADPTTTNASRCDSGSTILMASGGSPGQYRWYTQATGGTPITGEVNDTYTTPSLTSTTTYYVSINTGACESNRALVTATINPLPADPTTTNASRCDSGSTTLTASGASPGQYRWYTQATGGTPITGEVNDTYTTPSLASTTTYYVSIGIGTCESNRVVVTATINPIPSTPTTTGASRCDAGTVALTASGGSAGEYRWYATATGGTPIAGEVNDSFTTPTLTGTTAYYVAINNGACESNRAPVTATINTIPANPTPTGASRCGAGTVTLTAAGAAPGQYRWYTALTGGLPLSGEVNSTFVTPALPTSTDFYVSINDGFCESGRAAVTASINPVPAAPTTTSPNRCGPGSVSFTAAGGAAGQYRWYSLPTGGTAIPGEVNNTYTVNLTGTTSFYVAILQAGCESNRTGVVGTILSVPAIPTVTSSLPITNNQLELCPSTSATLTAPAGFAAYTWSTGSTGATTTVSQPGSVTLTVRNSDGCTSAPFALTVVSRTCAPAIAPPPPQTIPVEGQLNINVTALITSVLPIVPGSLRVTIAPASGARASFSPSGELRIDYSGVLFAGRDVLTIEVCNIAGECAQQQISIEVVGDIIIFNGISPNGDGENEFFYLQYIDVLPAARENQVSIFNRWGDLVWQTRNYDNIGNRFEGKNSSGGELPSGTYYYRIQFASGVSERAGYLSLKR